MVHNKRLRYYSYAAILLLLPIIYFVPSIVFKNIDKVSGVPFGNVLSSYFYYTNTSLADATVVKHYQNTFNLMPDSDLKAFFNKLSWFKRESLFDLYHSNAEGAWHSLHANGEAKNNYLQYWQALRPDIKRFYTKKFPPMYSALPVVHFRCSDSPFNRNPQYHLPKAISVKWMADQIKQRGFKKIVLLSCNSHNSIDEESCGSYADFYQQLFTNYGLQVQRQCNSVLQDFAIMLHSPLLVSLNASGYSFMAGIAKNPNDYVACNMGVEIDGKYYPQTQADWLLDIQQPLLHAQVRDYSDVNSVMKQLAE